MLMEHNIPVYEEFKKTLEENNKAMIVTTMGTGKSYLTLEYLEEMDYNALVICPTLAICNNWENLTSRVTTITYHSFAKLTDYGSYDCYVFDEAHHSGSTTWEPVIRDFMEKTDKPVIGLTADPKRYSDGGKDMSEELWDNRVVEGYNMGDAIEVGILPSITYICTMYDLGKDIKHLKSKGVESKLLSRLKYSDDNYCKIDIILKKHMPKGKRKGVVFADAVKRIPEAMEAIKKTYPNAKVWVIHSKQSYKKNREVLDEYNKADSGFLFTVDMLNEGLHIDGVNTVIMLRKTQSPTVYFQQIGRGMSAGKSQRIIVFDFVGNNTSLKMVAKRNIDIKQGFTTSSGKLSSQVIIKDYTKDIIDILEEAYQSLSREWSVFEDEILKSYYPTEGTLVYKRLEGRTRVACRARALLLGIENNRFVRWSKEDDKIIKKYYPTEGKLVAKRLSNGAEGSSIISRANILGVKYISKQWTAEDIRILRKYYPTEGPSGVAKRLENHSVNACQSKARNLKLNMEKNRWTSDEEEILRTYYPIEGSNVYKRLKGKTSKKCISKASSLGLKAPERYKVWSEEDDKIIKENFYTKTAKEIAELLGEDVSKDMVQKRSKFLKLSKANKKWTEEEDKILKENFTKIPISKLSSLVGRSVSGIYSRAKLLGLIKR